MLLNNVSSYHSTKVPGTIKSGIGVAKQIALSATTGTIGGALIVNVTVLAGPSQLATLSVA